MPMRFPIFAVRPVNPFTLHATEQEIASGAEGEDFLTVARQLRERVHGKV